jgi:hypothetical protein
MLDFSVPRKVKATMLRCVKEIVDDCAKKNGDLMAATVPPQNAPV